ncbi:MAG: M23 family metallopeptidase [Thermoleophilia bacterium]
MSAARELASVREPAAIPLARAGEVQLMLPIYEQQVTAVGYHPVNDRNVISLTPNGRQVNDSIFSSFSGSEGPGFFVMEDGSQPGSASNSMDVGAPAGTFVFAPVDGAVAGIRSYNLKGQCPDTEIRIQPLNQANVMVVMTHLSGIEATLGQPVKAGITRIGAVRPLDGCLEQQLGRFTYDSGNHLHLQVEAAVNTKLGR